MIRKLFFSLAFLFIFSLVYAQQENVPIDHNVYLFLKEMKVKGILNNISDDNPNLSRAEIKIHLEQIETYREELSRTEKNLLKKFQDEFYDDKSDSTNTYQIFGSGAWFSSTFSDIFSNKLKYAYAYRDPNATYNLEILGRFLYGQNFKPVLNNSELYDIGFRFRGTLFERLGYSLSVQKGGVSGSQDLAPTFDSRLNYNFKFIERIENIGNYDFAEGYLRYFSEPAEKMRLSFQIGREKIKFGYGYGSKLVLSGDHHYLDFLKLNFDYGIFSFTSIHGSTVGEYNPDHEQNFTKLIALNRFQLHFDKLFSVGLGENVIYSGRGIDLAYLNPFIFYKFVEMSLQDRDNGTLWLDFQSNFLKNIELQATFFLDENILSQLQDLNRFSNKTAYQLSAFWYSPFSINDFSLVLEYTKVRPYVYTHTNYRNSYTTFGQLLGHRIGPNSDEFLAQISYNLNERVRLNLEYQYVRAGENIYDAQGRLSFNSGGDPFIPYRGNIDPLHISFLDGERINKNIFTFLIHTEPIREVYFDLLFRIIDEKNITRETNSMQNYGYIKMWFEL